MRLFLVFILVFVGSFTLLGQDSLLVSKDKQPKEKENRIRIGSYILPSSLIILGSSGIWNYPPKFDFSIQQKVVNQINDPFKTIPVDDALVLASPLAVYGLNWLGVKGKHDFVDRSVVIGLSLSATYLGVTLLKNCTDRLRPDGTTYDSWPSGHTAIAFAGAEFFYQEYKERSVWYGITGYAMATTVGVFRVYNNRHWTTDVLAGAGIGIMATKLSYLVMPKISHLLRTKNSPSTQKTSFLIVPKFEGSSFQLHCLVCM